MAAASVWFCRENRRKRLFIFGDGAGDRAMRIWTPRSCRGDCGDVVGEDKALTERSIMSWSNPFILAFITTFFFVSSFEFLLSSATMDTMTPGQSLIHWQVLISAGNEFALGFFSPGESKEFYVAIWYNKLPTDPQTVVWVANRDEPIADSNGVFTLQDDGNLAVLDGTKKPSWNTSVSTNATRLVAVLLDSGNLVLRDGETTVWQSFDYPFDTFLPGMKIRVKPKTGSNRLLTSCKKDDNFRLGRLSFGVDGHMQNQLFIWYNLTKTNWQSGLWNGNNFEEIPEVNKNFLFYFTKNSSGDEVYFMYSTIYTYTRLVMDASGQLQFWIWYEPAEQWRMGWSTWRDGCDNPLKCGVYGICDSKNSPVCSCLPGFEPVSPAIGAPGIGKMGAIGRAGCSVVRETSSSTCQI
ncbi:G-type lectin S-receptor-like serine/threonine-protein kinase [Cinnamomum micranthum f. kanehirae]|uniref:G-type lectin S-receptor-like serine/threonine-protein kinase n=1 Tax=Cinnamomum micranthum f. kanehirae TaxID=337451 RepID=A0A443Q5J1_9MAGN|nr:G-type lectin S-receptor-like serine/threonine-protein kinase [Cinnamomum micranthum f. kanehirae]